MAGRRNQPPPLEPRQFKPDELKPSIVKLTRRIEDLKALDPKAIQPGDQAIENVAQAIRRTILDVYGPNSPEYKEHEHHHIWRGPMYIGMDVVYRRKCIADGIPQSIAMLQGLIRELEEKQQDLGADGPKNIRIAFAGLDLHGRIAGVASDLFQDGHYRNAVLDAAVALVNFVKERARRNDLDGAGLMRTVFSRHNPVLAFNDLVDQSDQDEQEGLMHLFEGVVLALRNPRAHAIVPDTAENALEYIALMSLLAKRLEGAKRLGP